MKLTLLLLPLFIAVCTAVSKSHHKLRTLAAQSGDPSLLVEWSFPKFTVDPNTGQIQSSSPPRILEDFNLERDIFTNTNPAELKFRPGSLKAIRGRFLSKTLLFRIKERIRVDNGHGFTYTWEIDSEGNKIGKELVQVPTDEGFTWTVTVEYEEDGSWKPSQLKLGEIRIEKNMANAIIARNEKPAKGEDEIQNARVEFICDKEDLDILLSEE